MRALGAGVPAFPAIARGAAKRLVERLRPPSASAEASAVGVGAVCEPTTCGKPSLTVGRLRAGAIEAGACGAPDDATSIEGEPAPTWELP